MFGGLLRAFGGLLGKEINPIPVGFIILVFSVIAAFDGIYFPIIAIGGTIVILGTLFGIVYLHERTKQKKWEANFPRCFILNLEHRWFWRIDPNGSYDELNNIITSKQYRDGTVVPMPGFQPKYKDFNHLHFADELKTLKWKFQEVSYEEAVEHLKRTNADGSIAYN